MPAGDRKKLSVLDATLLVMGGIIGVGLFFNPSQVAQSVREPWAFLGLWAFGGAVALCAALTFAELGATFPKAGGWFVFLREAFGPFPAFLFAWVVLFAVSSGSMASVLHFCADQLHRLAPSVVGEAASPSHRVVASGVMLGITGVALLGVKRAAVLQNLCMLTKLAVIAALVVGGFLVFAGESAPVAAGTLAPAPPLPEGLVRALLPVFFSYGGWQMVCYIAPEVRDPQRTLPRAIVLGVLGVVAVYLVANAAFLHVMGVEGVAADPAFAAEVARRTLGPAGERVLGAGMVVSALGICAVIAITTPWLYVAMAREGLFFSRFAHLHPTTGVPTLAILVQGALVVLYVNAAGLQALVSSVVFAEWIFHTLVAWSLLRLRARRPDLPRPFRSFAYPLAPVVYLVAALAVELGTLGRAAAELVGSGTPSASTSAVGEVVTPLAIVTVGALVYRPWRRLVGRRAVAEPNA